MISLKEIEDAAREGRRPTIQTIVRLCAALRAAIKWINEGGGYGDEALRDIEALLKGEGK